MGANAKFWDRISAKYARDPIKNVEAYERKITATQALMTPDMTVLEIACGTATTALRHAPHVHHIRATDLSGKMLAIARDRARDAGVENITFEQSSLEDLLVEDGSVDMVLAMSILHLLDDHQAGIAKVWRMLRPGGHFISSTTCMRDAANWFRFIAPLGNATGLLPLVRFFTRSDLEDSIRQAGFEITESWAPDPKAAVFIIAQKP